ncbi:MAG TPA: hypothetical protein VHR44_12880 [Beijerinckiaceae bacterium]|jgi:hypothetical protein|nr:hypothetical protein [Beijerinckiaceae bacterium]
MRHRLRVTLDIAGLICNLAAAGFAAAAVYVNQEALTALSTTAWGSTDQFKTALLWQSRDMILAAMLLAFGTALQVAAELVRDQPQDHRVRHAEPARQHLAAEHHSGSRAHETHHTTEAEPPSHRPRPRGQPRGQA